MKIKAASLTNLSDARYFAAQNADWVGFCLDAGDDSFVQPTKLKEMSGWIEGPSILGEFGAQSPADVRQGAELLQLDAVQVGFFYDVEQVKALSPIPVFKEIVVDNAMTEEDLEADLALFAPHVHAFVVDFAKNNLTYQHLQNGHPISLGFLKEACAKYPIYLALAHEPAQLKELLTTLSPEGIQLKGGAEERVGVKSFDDLEEVFEVLESL